LDHVAQFALILLLLMFLAMIAITAERLVRFPSIRRRGECFQQQLKRALHQDGITDGITQAFAFVETFGGNRLPLFVPAELVQLQASIASLPKNQTIEWAAYTLERMGRHVKAQLRKRLALMATISSTAPFVGFFGATVGITDAFKGCAAARAYCLAATAGGISYALIPGLAGLLVALPTVLLSRLLYNRANTIDLAIEASSSELINSFIVDLKRTN